MNQIKENDWIVYEREDGTATLVQANRYSEVTVGRKRAWADGLIGFEYGTVVELKPKTPEDLELERKLNENLKKRPQESSKKPLEYLKLVPVSSTELLVARTPPPPHDDGDDEEREEEDEEVAPQSSSSSSSIPIRNRSTTKDNRFINDDAANQTLEYEALLEMKRSGATGEEIIRALTENNTNFASKTAYSQEKYLKKLSSKWLPRVKLIRTNSRTAAEALFNKHPPLFREDRYRSLRWVDAIPQMLSGGNVHAASHTLVVDGVSGILAMAVLERQRGDAGGRCYLVATTRKETTPGYKNRGIDLLNLTRTEKASRLVICPTRDLRGSFSSSSSSSSSSREKEEDGESDVKRMRTSPPAAPPPQHTVIKSPAEIAEDAEVKSIAERRREEMMTCLVGGPGADGLVVASRHDPCELVPFLLPFLGGGMPFVVHSPYVEPLLALKAKLEHERLAIDVMLTESFWRELQVLPERTHPLMTGSSSGGFILKGVRVLPDTR